MRRCFTGIALALGGLLTLTAFPVCAQEWPAKPVKIVVAFAAGGTADIFARLLAPELSSALGQQFVVENRPGASGLPGSAHVAQAEADGYTLLICGSGPHITGPAMNANAGYDPLRDFTHLAMIAGDTYTLVASKSFGAKSVAELKASGKSGIATGSPGAGSLGHLLIEQIRRQTGIDLAHVPYRSVGESMNDLLGGHIGLVMTPLISAGEQIRANSVTPLGVTTAERNPAFPLIPTFVEQGLPIRGSGWFWLCGPRNLPEPIARRLSAETRRIIHGPAIKARFEREALISPDMDSSALQKFVGDEIALWGPLIRELGLKVQ